MIALIRLSIKSIHRASAWTGFTRRLLLQAVTSNNIVACKSGLLNYQALDEIACHVSV